MLKQRFREQYGRYNPRRNPYSIRFESKGTARTLYIPRKMSPLTPAA